MSGACVIRLARTWIGTPYCHQASCRGAGADCLGLVRGIWRDLLGEEAPTPPPYAMDWGETGSDELLWQAMRAHLTQKRTDEAAPGDILLFRMQQDAIAKHLGIQARGGENASFIHAFSRHGVVESSLSSPWRRRVVACFTFPERRL